MATAEEVLAKQVEDAVQTIRDQISGLHENLVELGSFDTSILEADVIVRMAQILPRTARDLTYARLAIALTLTELMAAREGL